ncbi:MAG TPA: SGNH/GDSL hydrolase family protein [Candidatus Limnocylindrales bacterium]|nr:SGNH/GDSL hydrolase family protein [Candidatus Limnocylindrales bacterium]
MKLKTIMVATLLAFSILGTLAYFAGFQSGSNTPQRKNAVAQVVSTSTPVKDVPFRTYTAPNIEKKREYTIVMIGDSMTHALGPHGGPFYEKLNALFKDNNHGILIDNYAGPSTNILTLDKAMNTTTTFAEWTFEPLLSRQFDLILIESFGYNPLSQFGVENGIKRQNEELEKLMNTLIKTHPKSAIMFVATIAPNKANYGKLANPNDPPEARAAQVDERISYIRNHIKYATEHNIPVINIFEKSLTAAGDGNLEYINPNDYIHPSAVGIEFISGELANFIYDSQIFPR